MHLLPHTLHLCLLIALLVGALGHGVLLARATPIGVLYYVVFHEILARFVSLGHETSTRLTGHTIDNFSWTPTIITQLSSAVLLATDNARLIMVLLLD